MTARTLETRLLAEALGSANKVARRLLWSRSRIGDLMPLGPDRMAALSDEDEERLDAFLLRFNSLMAMIQDHVIRGLLVAEEEDVKDRSRKDQRLLMEKLGALQPQSAFGTLAELRNRIAHHYPDDAARQAAILNEVFERSEDLLAAHDSVLDYANRKVFGGSLALGAVSSGARAPTQR